MKYTTEITVNVPRETFIKKMDNPENMKHWQRGLVGYKILTDSIGQEGSQMEMRYKMGKRDLVLVETILKTNFPYEFHATYNAKDVRNIQRNYFKELDQHSTKWISESEFEFSGFMMRAMAFLVPKMFKKQSLAYQKDFKAYAENGTSVAISQ